MVLGTADRARLPVDELTRQFRRHTGETTFTQVEHPLFGIIVIGPGGFEFDPGVVECCSAGGQFDRGRHRRLQSFEFGPHRGQGGRGGGGLARSRFRGGDRRGQFLATSVDRGDADRERGLLAAQFGQFPAQAGCDVDVAAHLVQRSGLRAPAPDRRIDIGVGTHRRAPPGRCSRLPITGPRDLTVVRIARRTGGRRREQFGPTEIGGRGVHQRGHQRVLGLAPPFLVLSGGDDHGSRLIDRFGDRLGATGGLHPARNAARWSAPAR